MRETHSRGQLEGIQVARALAAMLVVGVHTVDLAKFRHVRHEDQLGWLSDGRFYSDFGASGVDFFFVISGFVMAMVLMQPVERSPGSFLNDRFIRIVPFYWLISFFALIQTCWLARPLELGNLAISLSLLPLLDPENFTLPVLFVGWTLAFEFAFYLSLLPWLRVGQSRRLWGAMLTTAALACTGWLLAPRLDLAALFLNPIWFEFLAGILLFSLWRRGLSNKAGLVAGAAGLLILAAGFATHIVLDVRHFALFDGDTGTVRAFVWGIPYAMVLAALLSLEKNESVTGTRLLWRGLCRIGDASYSLYLVHPMLLLVVEYRLPPNLLPPDIISLLSFVLAIAIGLIVHRWIELPLLAWLKSKRQETPANTARCFPSRLTPPARPAP